MSWNQIEGQWKQRRGKAIHHWGKMTKDKSTAIAGKYEEPVGSFRKNTVWSIRDGQGGSQRPSRRIQKSR
jgi:uncharacterized protein YjbJ (UPF0337 family)